MELFITILVCFLAGAGAGLGTGFAGLSAAAVITPLLITFLGVDTYTAVGIALASDVLASAISAYTYKKNENIDVKNGIVILITVLAFTMVGSYVASFVSSSLAGNVSIVMTALLGLRFIFIPVKTTKEKSAEANKTKRLIKSIIFGCLVGFVCGFVGAGGGLMMLLIFTSVLGYDLKTAVGTSVFVMTFTALTGAVSHFVIKGFPDPLMLGLCAIFTLIWARIGARIANKSKEKVLNLTTGILLLSIGVSVLIVNLIK
ncbi:MAG: sulfite exporter TauE/SafE family protein [Clostridiales bacterium]|nr:sulfite exporter TauE/SafE family protein [Clostridiales bacterium]